MNIRYYLKKIEDQIKEFIYGPKVYFVVGPTSSGKTAYAINLAKRLKTNLSENVTVVSADSRQVYKDFNLSSGKVTKEEMDGVPHELLDIALPGEYFSVEDFKNQALKIIYKQLSMGLPIIVCGGTGFYIDSLIYDYKLPKVKPNLDLRKKYEKVESSIIWEEIQKLDPDYAEFEATNKNNKHRMLRALEIIKSLGKMPPIVKKKRFKNYEIIYLNPGKEILNDKIKTRLQERLDAGMIEEIKLVKEKYNLSFEYLESLGLEFKHVSRFLKGEVTKEQMFEDLFTAIVQYAKRQRTWFKRYKNLPHH